MIEYSNNFQENGKINEKNGKVGILCFTVILYMKSVRDALYNRREGPER